MASESPRKKAVMKLEKQVVFLNHMLKQLLPESNKYLHIQAQIEACEYMLKLAAFCNEQRIALPGDWVSGGPREYRYIGSLPAIDIADIDEIIREGRIAMRHEPTYQEVCEDNAEKVGA